jgi:hypothetical protein
MRPEWDEIERHNRPLQSPPQRVALVVVVALLVTSVWAYLWRDKAGREAVREPEVAEATVVPPLPMIELPKTLARIPSGAGESVGAGGYVEPRGTRVQIYECLVDGQRVISDQRCAADAKVRSLVVPRPDSAAVARLHQKQQRWPAQQQQLQAQQRSQVVVPPPSVASTAGSTAYATPASNESACADVDKQIEMLNAQMRQAYGSARGEWYRSQWHSLKERRYRLGCGR